MSVEYPQVIAAIQEWIGKNKFTTDSGHTVSDSKVAREKNFLEFALTFATQLLSTVFKGPDTPGALSSSQFDAFKKLTDTVTSKITGYISDAFDAATKFLTSSNVDPSVVTENGRTAVAALGSPANATLTSAFNEIKTYATGAWKATQDTWSEYTKALSGQVTVPEGYTFSQAIANGNLLQATSIASGYTTQVVADVTGIKGFTPAEFMKTAIEYGPGKGDYAQQIADKYAQVASLNSDPTATLAQVQQARDDLIQLHTTIDASIQADKENYATAEQQNQYYNLIGQIALDYLATDDEDIRQFIKDSCQPGVWDAVEAFLVLWTSTLTAETIITTSDPEPLWPTTTPAAETKTASNPAVVPSEGRQT